MFASTKNSHINLLTMTRIDRIALLIIPALLAGVVLQAQIYEFRGEGRTGIFNETNLLSEWPSGGPPLIWEVSGFGTGYSSVTPTADAVYVTGRMGDYDIVTSYSHDGTKNWEINYGRAWDRTYPETRSIPTFYNGHLYLVSGQGDIVCVSANGEKRWSVNHFEKYNAPAPRFGISESPLVADGKVFVTPGGSQTSLVAFDAETGNLVWATEALDEGAQYVNPTMIEHNGRRMVVTLLTNTIIGVDPSDGTIIWSVDYAGMQSGRARVNHAVTPLFRDGFIFVTSGYNHTAVKLQLSPDGSSADVVWTNDDIDTHHGGAVLLGDYLFASNYQSNTMGDWVCVDWNSGETKWATRWNTKGSIIAADGLLYLYEERRGNLALVRPDPRGLDIISEFRLNTRSDGPFWAHPVIHNGRLYVRHGDYLAVFDISN